MDSKATLQKALACCKKGNLIPAGLTYIKRNKLLYKITNEKIRDLQLQEETLNKLQKKYNYIKERLPKMTYSNAVSKKLFVCWFQGFDAAPPIVKSCSESLGNITGYNIEPITSKNMHSYVDIPANIMDKWGKGIIPAANFSDILRLRLLEEHGGIWCDATVLATHDTLPSYITEAELFVYQDIMGCSPGLISNWFIAAKQNNHIIKTSRILLEEYWQKENYARHYFVTHLCFRIATEWFPNEWGSVPRFSNQPPHIMALELNSLFNPERWEELKKISSIHKLSHHQKTYGGNSLYAHIIT